MAVGPLPTGVAVGIALPAASTVTVAFIDEWKRQKYLKVPTSLKVKENWSLVRRVGLSHTSVWFPGAPDVDV